MYEQDIHEFRLHNNKFWVVTFDNWYHGRLDRLAMGPTKKFFSSARAFSQLGITSSWLEAWFLHFIYELHVTSCRYSFSSSVLAMNNV